MIKAHKTVVPFERPAAYWASRARRHYTPAKFPDAARLLRKALEKSGDPAMALELSQIYASMECHTAAERYLLQAVAQGGLTGDACFAIGCCALNRDDDALAKQALEASLRLDPNGSFSEQAQNILETRRWYEAETPPMGARGNVLYQRARRALSAGDSQRARELAQQAWEKSHTSHAAMLVGGLSDPDEAIPFLRYSVHYMPGEQRPLLLLAQACFMDGRQEEAKRQLQLARMFCSTIAQAEAFCAIAWETEHLELAQALITERLESAPASVDYLRLKYLTLKRMGDEEGAQRALQTLLDVDPDDAAGLWYRRHPEDVRFYAGRLMPFTALSCQVNALPCRLKPGPLNRALHRMVMLLADSMTIPVIYRLLPPLWRRLSPAEKAACDQRNDNHYLQALALYLLVRTGQKAQAAALFASIKGKKRAQRLLTRFTRLMNEE